MTKCSHREDSGLLVEVDGVHDDEDLLVLVRQPARLLQGGLAVVLNPSMLAQEGGWQPDGQACNQGWVYNGQWVMGNGQMGNQRWVMGNVCWELAKHNGQWAM